MIKAPLMSKTTYTTACHGADTDVAAPFFLPVDVDDDCELDLELELELEPVGLAASVLATASLEPPFQQYF